MKPIYTATDSNGMQGYIPAWQIKIAIIVIALSLAMGSAKAQNIVFKSKSFYNGQLIEQPHTIKILYGIGETACDTLVIDNQRYDVLSSGSTGEYKNNKPYWDLQFYGFKNSGNHGRWISSNTQDYDFRVYITVGFNMLNKHPYKITIINHGLYATYLP